MGTVFLLLVFTYLFCFLYKAMGGNNSISNLYLKIQDSTTYVYNNILNFPRAQASNLILALKTLQKNIKKWEKTIPILKIRKYIGLAVIIHIIGFYIINHFVVINLPKIKENWQYITDLAEETSIPVEFNEAPPEYDTVSYAEENIDDSGKIGDNSENLDLPKLHSELPPQAYNAVPTPVIHRSNPKYSGVILAGTSIGGGLGSSGKGKGSYGNGSGGKGTKEGKIMGDTIKAKKLGVVLDNSNSMGPFIPMLEMEIRNNFSNPQITRVNGCQVTSFSDVIFAFKYLSTQDVDVVYWFCDLQDMQDKEGLEALNKILKDKNIKLYVKSMDKSPNNKLSSIISSSGGSCLTKSN
jgi:hypothetical protein